MSALAGRRVVVTRAQHQAGALASLLAARGALVEHVPLVAIEEAADGGAALRDALARIGSYDWVVVTSPNGAERVAPALAGRGAPPRIAAVGAATDAALGPRSADLVARRATGAGLVADFPSGSGRVLIAQGDRAGPTVSEGLRALGWRVDVVTAYRTVARPPEPAAAERAPSADAVLFASGSAVGSWVEAFGAVAPPVVVAIGPSTAAALAAHGLQVTRIAADQSVEGLVVALESAFGDPR